MIRAPATIGGDGIANASAAAAASDPYTTLVDVDFRTASNEDLAALGDGTISRPWGADAANVSVVLTDTSAGSLDITADGLVVAKTGAAATGVDFALDLNGLLDADDTGVRVVVQVAAGATFPANAARIQAFLGTGSAGVVNPGRAVLAAYIRHGASDYGARTTAYNDGTWQTNYDHTGQGVDATNRIHLEIRQTPRGWVPYMVKDAADALPSRATMGSAIREYGFLDGVLAPAAIELRYLWVVLTTGSTAAHSVTIERIWILKGAL